MKGTVENYDYPDFGLDDDTEDMTGVSIHEPYHKIKNEIQCPPLMPELPPELDIYNKGTDGTKKKEKAME